MTMPEPPKCTRATMTMEFADGSKVRFDAEDPLDAMIDIGHHVPEIDAGYYAEFASRLPFPNKVRLSIAAGLRHPMTLATWEKTDDHLG